MLTMVDFIQWYRNRINKHSPYHRSGWTPIMEAIDPTFYKLCESLWSQGRLDGHVYIYASELDPDYTWCICPTQIGLSEWNNVNGVEQPEDDFNPAV